MAPVQAQRTLVKSPPELWAELSDLEYKLLQSQTEIHTLEESLGQAEAKLKKSVPLPTSSPLSATETEVMLSIAQELRTPMSSIEGYVDLLLGESVGILGELQRRFLSRVKANADRLGSLLEDFIRVTALDTGQHRRHAAQPQRTDQLRQAEIGIEVLGHREDVGGGLLVKAGGQDRRETPGGRSLDGRAEIQPNSAWVVGVDVQKQR